MIRFFNRRSYHVLNGNGIFSPFSPSIPPKEMNRAENRFATSDRAICQGGTRSWRTESYRAGRIGPVAALTRRKTALEFR